jgi:hypothetical protein
VDARAHELTENIRAKRIAIDNRLELIRVRLQQQDPRAAVKQRWPMIAAGSAAIVAIVYLWRRRRHRRSAPRQVRQDDYWWGPWEETA